MKPQILKPPPAKPKPPKKDAVKPSAMQQLAVIGKQLQRLPEFLLIEHNRWIELAIVLVGAGIALYAMSRIYFLEPMVPPTSSIPRERGLNVEQLQHVEQSAQQQTQAADQDLVVPAINGARTEPAEQQPTP